MAKKRKYLENVVNPVLETGNHWETDPFEAGVHNGEDLINRTPTTSAKPCWIIAIEDGLVYKVGYGTKKGYYVAIKHDNGYYSVYMHMKKGTIVVKEGDLITKGSRIGFMGESGNAVGVHLHLAIEPKLNSTYVDPYPYLIGEKTLKGKWENGVYMTLKQKYVRTSPKVVSSNKVKYSTLVGELKQKCNKDVNGKARFIKGAILDLTDFTYDLKGNMWGKVDKYWLCVKDSSGNQVTKL